MSLPGGYIGPICLGNKLQQIDSVHLLISSGSPPIAEGVAIPHHLLLPIKVAVPCVHVGVCREKHFKKATQVNDTYGLITDNLNALQLHYSLVCACVCVYVCVCVCITYSSSTNSLLIILPTSPKVECFILHVCDSTVIQFLVLKSIAFLLPVTR